MLWSACQRFGVLILSFISNLVLARYLTPEDFGAIGMLTIFISLSETFIDSGLGSALIQKKDTTEIDYSTVFWTNLIISIFLYVVLFLFAPLIARFYNMELLTSLLRVKAIVLIIQGFRLIQTTRLQKSLNFKKISLVYLSASLISTIAAIIASILGLGVWALVIKTLLDTSIRTIVFWIIGKWKPLFKFSFKSFKELFSYGGVMLCTSLVISIYSNVQTLIIGKAFSATDLGYYTQAKKLETIPTNAVEQIVNQVTFPVFSRIKDDVEKLKNSLKKIVICISYITFPMMIFFIVAATPIFEFLFTSKWNQSIPYFRYLCLVGMMVSVNTMNTNIIKASGRKKMYFNLQVIKRLIGIVILIISVFFGMAGLLTARVIIEYVFFAINTHATKKIINYSTWEEVKDFLPNYLLSFISGIITYFAFKYVSLPNLALIILEFIVYVVIYLGVSSLLKFKGFTYIFDILKNNLFNRGKNGAE